MAGLAWHGFAEGEVFGAHAFADTVAGIEAGLVLIDVGDVGLGWDYPVPDPR